MDRPAPLAALAFVFALLVALPCRADVDVYQVAVPLQGATEADRQAGFAAALRATAVRATGQRDAATNAAVVQAAADPAKYVQQYGTTADRMLKVGFDPGAVEQLLLRAGLPLWPAERPATLVLVAVPAAGGSSRIIREGDTAPERTAIERAAQSRGLPLLWPRVGMDIGQARAQVLAGEADSVATAAGAERARAVLVGVASAGGAEWVFGEPGRPAQGRGSLQDGINLAADTLAARYAPASTRSLATLSIRVGGVESVRAYAGLLEYLQSLSMVRQVSVEELAGGTVRLGVTLRGDLAQLRRIAALDGRLQPASDVDFTYQ